MGFFVQTTNLTKITCKLVINMIYYSYNIKAHAIEV